MDSTRSTQDSKASTTASRQRKPAAKTPAPQHAEAASAQQNLAGVDPISATPNSLLALQRKIGNRAASRLIQTKLNVGAANDKYEQEADQVAQQVMRNSAPNLQRHHTEGEEEGVQRKPLAGGISSLVQRHSLPPSNKKSEDEEQLKEEDEGGVQRKSATPNMDGGFAASRDVEQRIAAQSGHGQSLPGGVQRDMEGHFGTNFSGVRVHTGSEAVQLNRDLSAQAFTHGQDIYFGSGKYNPTASSGKQLLAHELTHVVQQTGPGKLATKRIQRIKSPRQWWRDREKKKQEGSFNIRWGQELPGTKEMGDTMIKERIEAERSNVMDHTSSEMNKREVALHLPLMLAKLDEGTFMGEVLSSYNDKNPQKTVEVGVLNDVRDALKKHIPSATDMDDAGYKAKEDLKKIKDKAVMARINFVYEIQNRIKTLATEQAQSTPVGPATSVYSSRDQNFLSGDSTEAAKRFWDVRGTYEMDSAYLDKAQRKAFSAALKFLPTVQALLNPKATPKDFRQTTGWKDGGNLADKITVVKDVEKPEDAYMPSPYRLLSKSRIDKINDKRANSQTFRNKVNTVDRLTRVVVEPAMLRLVERPKISMHTAPAIGFTSPWGYRANASKGEVDVSYDETMDTIAHEVGHAVEHFLPLERWHDIHMLMGARHQAAGGGKARAGATPLITSLSEGRYAGKYTTGKYTTTAYKTGNAEVISMAMQYFSKPKKALELINGDPQHAAIVLRAFQPDEYAATEALRAFDKYIPHQKAKPQKPPKPSPEKIKAMKERMQKAKPEKPPRPSPEKMQELREKMKGKPLPEIPVKKED